MCLIYSQTWIAFCHRCMTSPDPARDLVTISISPHTVSSKQSSAGEIFGCKYGMQVCNVAAEVLLVNLAQLIHASVLMPLLTVKIVLHLTVCSVRRNGRRSISKHAAVQVRRGSLSYTAFCLRGNSSGSISDTVQHR